MKIGVIDDPNSHGNLDTVEKDVAAIYHAAAETGHQLNQLNVKSIMEDVPSCYATTIV